jgi:hypothetical protein
MGEIWFVLGFDYDDVIDAFQDARLAAAIESLWNAASRPADAQARWEATADEYAFRWYLNDRTARLLDEANVHWRRFIIGQTDVVPAKAFDFLHTS